MKNKWLPVVVTGIMLLLVGSLASCASTPPTMPVTAPNSAQISPEPQSTTSPVPPITPIPKPDIPQISEEEMAAFIWNMLPLSLPDGYTKSQFKFAPEPRKATYRGNGKWEFWLFGTSSMSNLLPLRNYEKTPGNWVQNHSREVTTYNLVLIATYYEKTATLDITDIQKLDEKTTVETLSEEPIIGKGLRVDWISGQYDGSWLYVQGSVTNIGVLPLENLKIEVSFYDQKGSLVRTDNVQLSPSKIEVGEYAKFDLRVQRYWSEGGTYRYRFLLPTGEEIFSRKMG